MHQDANCFTSDPRLRADYCIIGAGPAGLSLALELASTGKQVLLLESGGDKPEERSEKLLEGQCDSYGYSLRETRARCMGGSSIKWFRRGARMRTLDPIDFESRDCLTASWPFSLETLNDYYARANPYLGIKPHDLAIDNDPKTQKNAHLIHSTCVETKAFRTCYRKTWRKHHQALAAASNVQVLTHANVTELIASQDGERIERVLCKNQNGRSFSVAATCVILAAGGIEVPRLLLASNKVHKCGIGNHSDHVGRYFMEHIHGKLGCLHHLRKTDFDHGYYVYHRENCGPVEGCIRLKDEVLRREGLLNATYWMYFYPAITDAAFPKIYGREMLATLKERANVWGDFRFTTKNAIRYAFRRARPPGASKNVKYRKGFISVFVEAEQSPNPESRVLLTDERDAMGVRQVKLDWRIAKQDFESIERSADVINQKFFAPELGTLKEEPDLRSGQPRFTVGSHHIGTTRMHSNPQQGVVDEDCRVHGVNNLYVASSSVFPTSGAGNPTHTIVALAIRLADHLKLRLPSVVREAADSSLPS